MQDASASASGSESVRMLAQRMARGPLFAVVALLFVSAFWPRGRSGSSIHLESQPSGASVFINGRLAGATPVDLSGLKPGGYGLRLEKEGFKPFSGRIEAGEESNFSQKLDPLPTGSLVVNVEPAGAEVLLDGEVVGHTPVTLVNLAIGQYELEIRKTNYDSYRKHIEVNTGDKQTFSGFKLNDKVFAMLDSLLKTEPQRVAHYIDLAHYFFVNDQVGESVEVFAQGLETMQKPLDFDGPGYNGRKNMTADEIEVEQRLRREDEQRYRKELDKHREWPGKDTRVFRQKMEEAQELLSHNHIQSWEWAQRTALFHAQNSHFEQAARILHDHIAAMPAKAESLPNAWLGLVEIQLMQHDLAKSREAFDKFVELGGKNGPLLGKCGAFVYSYYDRMTDARDRQLLMEMAETSLRKAKDAITAPDQRAPVLYQLGSVLTFEEKAAEAVPLLQESVKIAADANAKEQYSLGLASALRKSGKLSDAKQLYTTLAESKQPAIKEGAKAGLAAVAADEAHQK